MLDRHQEENRGLVASREREAAEGRGLTSSAYDMEKRVGDRSELDGLRYRQQKEQDRHLGVRAEIDAMNKHVGVLENQNK